MSQVSQVPLVTFAADVIHVAHRGKRRRMAVI